MNQMRTERDDSTVDALNELLRGELSAVESYDKALPAVEDKPALRSDLQARGWRQDRSSFSAADQPPLAAE